MYVREISEESRIYLILYMEDMLITRRDKAEIEELKQRLPGCFSMKELGEVRYILGMSIGRDRSKTIL